MSLVASPDSQHHQSKFPPSRSGQHSTIAKVLMETRAGGISNVTNGNGVTHFQKHADNQENGHLAPPLPNIPRPSSTDVFVVPDRPKPAPVPRAPAQRAQLAALNDTPAPTAPGSPNIAPMLRRTSVDGVKRQHPTTLDIPGLTKSAVSPDGRIAQRDVGAKLVIVMVGLPARGKSYITKKVARYLNWLQHDTRIFNVGERRRVAASGTLSAMPSPVAPKHRPSSTGVPGGIINRVAGMHGATLAAHMLMNNENAIQSSPEPQNELPPPVVPILNLPEAANKDGSDIKERTVTPPNQADTEAMDQSADFFDPSNHKAALIREQCALDTLDELLDYIVNGNGSVGILDATNSTLARRQLIIKHVRERAGPDLNVLFLESLCLDDSLLEANMRLKLSGPDYKGKDPDASLADFRKRVEIYQKNYVPIGDWEEKNNISYIQMVDVGRKVISHQIKGFLSAQAVYYLLNFNLAPRQIWITRHGESEDNLTGKLGGDSILTENGRRYAKALTDFITVERKNWEIHELDRQARSHLPPQPGDTTPPNPYVSNQGDEQHVLQKSFCVWTSMLHRSVQTAQYFNDEDFDLKQMRMLNELNAGMYEGSTYKEIKESNRFEFDSRREDKLTYRYPGAGGEGYLDVINRLRPVIVELERMTDHCLLIAHRSVARILLAYFRGLPRDDVTDLDIPLGMLYCLEPKPYGVDFKAYRYDNNTDQFSFIPGYKLQRANSNVD